MLTVGGFTWPQGPPKIPLLLRRGDWFATPPAPPDWLVEPVFVHPNKILFAGESGALKSWVLADLALHVAAGKSWLGFTVPRARRIVFINEDMSQDDLQARFYQLSQGHGINPRGLPLWITNNEQIRVGLSPSGQPLSTLALLKQLKDAGCDPDVVMFETLLRVSSGLSNSNDDMANFYNALKPITDDPAHARTVIVSHHLTKFAGEPDNPIPLDKRILGAGYIKGGADAVFAIELDSKLDRRATISFHKMRRGPIHRPFRVQLECAGVDQPAQLVRVQGQTQPSRAPKAATPAPVTSLFTIPLLPATE